MERYNEEVPLLVAQKGPLYGQRWALHRTTLIGREPGCDIVVPDRQVSRHHARLQLTPDGLLLEDLSSKNGTHHNGQAIRESVLLQDGDIIQIALAQKFIYLSSDSTVPLEDTYLQDLQSTQTPTEAAGRLRLDKRSRRVWINIQSNENAYQEIEILPPLSVSQFHLLEILYDNQGRVIPRQDAAIAVWGKEQAFEVSEQALDALVRRLRDRIATVDRTHDYVVTVRGHGLRLENPPI
ncbi:MAG: FHA domain-containing protein [Anaerolineales bacterium]|nr:FHA domain-containing protein [Anaerolineales bacterium]